MNNDLHDIDDLFRNGIEGHEEEVPSSLWEAVSNDLDKKQASYYKSKFRRVKRAAWLLLLLCFAGAAYFVYDVLNHRRTADVQKNSVATTPTGSSGEEKQSQQKTLVNKAASNKTAADKSAGVQEPVEQHVIETTANEQPSNKTGPFSGKQPVEKQNSIQEEHRINHELATTNSQLVPPDSFSANNRQHQPQLSVEKSVIKRNGTSKTVVYTPQPLPDVTGTVAIRSFPLLEWRHDVPALNFDAMHQNISLLPNTKSKAAKTKAAHEFSLSAFAAPNINFDRLKDDNRLAGPGRNRQEAHREEQENASFSGGLLLNYEIATNWSLQSGVTVTSSSTSIAPKTVYAKPDNNGRNRYELHCSSGYVYISPKGGAQPAVGDSARTAGTTSKLTYATIPASVGYRINAGRFSLSPSLGAGLNILTSGNATTSLSNTVSNERTTTTISGLKSTYVDGHIGIGIDYRLSKKLAVGIRPNAKLALTPINQETPVKSYQNFLSVETGVRIKL